MIFTNYPHLSINYCDICYLCYLLELTIQFTTNEYIGFNRDSKNRTETIQRSGFIWCISVLLTTLRSEVTGDYQIVLLRARESSVVSTHIDEKLSARM